jgi:hypothetical protein
MYDQRSGVRETGPPDDHATAESPTPEVTMIVVADLSKEVARASTAQDMTLVLSPSHRLVSPLLLLLLAVSV